MFKEIWFGIFLTVLLVFIGQWNHKIGLALAALIFLGTVVYNIKGYEQIMKGEVF